MNEVTKSVKLLQFFIAKDQQVVDGFSDLLSKTEERETKINMITKRLDEELVYLSKFLENLATRRPVRMYICYVISCLYSNLKFIQVFTSMIVIFCEPGQMSGELMS